MTPTLRIVLAIAAVLGVGESVPASAQTFEGIVTMKVHGGDSAREPREMQYALRQGVARVEMPGRGDARGVMIIDRSAKTTTMLMPAQKKYMVVPIPQGVGEHRTGDHPRAEIVRTGRKETIAGYECEHWLVKGGEHEIDACVASGLGTLKSTGMALLLRMPFQSIFTVCSSCVSVFVVSSGGLPVGVKPPDWV